MAVVVTINSLIPDDPARGIDKTQSALIVEGSLTLSGTYGGASPANGDVINFTSDGNGARLTSNARPRRVEIFQAPVAGHPPVAYTFIYAYGTTIKNGELIVIDSTTGLMITQGAAYPGALTVGIGSPPSAPNIRFRAFFPLFIA